MVATACSSSKRYPVIDVISSVQRGCIPNKALAAKTAAAATRDDWNKTKFVSVMETSVR